MTMKLIGAGFGRTGTLSLKSAIETLGAGPCYHMLEVSQNPGHATLWHEAAVTGDADWDALLRGYPATVDWPGCYFWRQLVRAYPEAKVLLSVRSPESWYASVRGTIYQSMSNAHNISNEAARSHLEMARKIVLEDTFDGRFEDAEYAMGVFEQHNADVVAAIPPERLLIYEVGSGWEPLCGFLACPIPEQDYPHVNKTADFQDRMREIAKANAAQ
jgi:hypothetical protein